MGAGGQPEPAGVRPPDHSGPGSRWRTFTRWGLGGLLVLDLFLLLFALSFSHVTAQGPAKRSLRQSIAILTEIDAYLDQHWEALRADAARAEVEALAPPDFAVDVSFTTQEILGSEREVFRALLLTRAAERVYEDGMSAFREDQETDFGFFSLQGAVRNGMNFVRPDPHDVLTVATAVLAVLGAALALGLIAASRGFGGLLGLGVSISLAALPFLILAIAVRFALRLAADGLNDYLAEEFLALGQELTWAPIRNGIIFSVGGGTFVVLGAALALWSERRYADG